MDIPFYQIDAFTTEIFGGNPAAVLQLEAPLEDSMLQSIAAENNLSETAFLLKNIDSSPSKYSLRWFTPTHEVDLCGHATLASAHVIFSENDGISELHFETKSGTLRALRVDDHIQLDFPSRPPKELLEIPKYLTSIDPIGAFASRDLVLLFQDQEEIESLVPVIESIAKQEYLGLIVTAPGHDCDFVSRFFAPKVGVAEDPVTGSAHATLTPFWHSRLNKEKMKAMQLSRRGGELLCEVNGDRVKISGNCRSVITGTFSI